MASTPVSGDLKYWHRGLPVGFVKKGAITAESLTYWLNGLPVVIDAEYAGSLGTIPDVVGQSEASAEAELITAGFLKGTVTTVAHLTIPAGSVVSQSPVSGYSAALGTGVDLVLSTGPIDVPDVLGQTEVSAETELVAAGLVKGTVTVDSSLTVAFDLVISQDPVAGTDVAPGTSVDLVLSVGPPESVPDVVGMSEVAATAALEAENLVLGYVTRVPHLTLPPGTVMAQYPKPGTVVLAGSTVELRVARTMVRDLTRIQSTGGVYAAAANKLTFSFATPPRYGSALVVFVATRRTPASTHNYNQTKTLSDNKCNTWKQAYGTFGPSQITILAVYYCPRVVNTGDDYEITVQAFDYASGTTPVSGVDYDACAVEWDGPEYELELPNFAGENNAATANPHYSDGMANVFGGPYDLIKCNFIVMNGAISDLTAILLDSGIYAPFPPRIEEFKRLDGTVTAMADSQLYEYPRPPGYGWNYQAGNYWTPGTPNQASTAMVVAFQQGLPATWTPNLLGMHVNDAWDTVIAAPMVRGTVTWVTTGGAPGEVLAQYYRPETDWVPNQSSYAQEPLTEMQPGVWITQRTVVYLTAVALVPAAVPDLIGMTAAEAAEALAPLYFNLGGPMAVYSASAPLDEILTQSPAAGAMLTVESTVETTTATRDVFPVVESTAISHHNHTPGPVPAAPSLSIVQQTPVNSAADVSQISATFTAPVSKGNALVVVVTAQSCVLENRFPNTAAACRDFNLGESSQRWQQATTRVNRHSMTAIYFLPRIFRPSAGLVSVTVKPVNPASMTIQAFEVTGIGTQLAYVPLFTNEGGRDTEIVTGSTPPLLADHVLLVAACATDTSQSAITVESVSPSWNTLFESLAGVAPGEANYRIRSGVLGTMQSCAWTASAEGDYAAGLAAFVPTPSPGAINGEGPHVVQVSPKAQVDGAASVVVTLSATPVVGHGVIVSIVGRAPYSGGLRVFPATITDNYGNVYTESPSQIDVEAVYPSQLIRAMHYYCSRLAVVGPGLTIGVTGRADTTHLTAQAIEVDCALALMGQDTLSSFSSTVGHTGFWGAGIFNPPPGMNVLMMATVATERPMTSITPVTHAGEPTWVVGFTELGATHACGQMMYREYPNLMDSTTANWNISPGNYFAAVHTLFVRRQETTHVVTLPSGIQPGDLIFVSTYWVCWQMPNGLGPEHVVQWPMWLIAEWYHAFAGSGNERFLGHGCWGKHADGTEGATVSFTIPWDAPSSTVAFRISGHKLRMAALPVSMNSNVSESSGNGFEQRYLWLAVEHWSEPMGLGVHGDLAHVLAPPAEYGRLVSSGGGTPTSLGVAHSQRAVNTDKTATGSFRYDWPRTTGFTNALQTQITAEGRRFAIWPEETDLALTVPLAEIFRTDWPVVKRNSGMMTENYLERPYDAPIGGVVGGTDPDYPLIWQTEAVQVGLGLEGRHVITNDYGDEDPYTEVRVTEIGQEPIGLAPGNPNAGDNVANPLAGWWNAKQGRITIDVQLTWNNPEFHGYILNIGKGQYDTDHLNLWVDYDYKIPDVEYWWLFLEWSDAIRGVISEFYPDYGTAGWNSGFAECFPLRRSEWLNKRVRFVFTWKCGTMVLDEDGYMISTAPDGFLTVTMQDLTSTVTDRLPAGTLAFSAYGDFPIKFVSPAGAILPTILSPHTGDTCGFISTLPNHKIVCIGGGSGEGEGGIFNYSGIGIYPPDCSTPIKGDESEPGGNFGWTGAIDRQGYLYAAGHDGEIYRYNEFGHQVGYWDTSSQLPGDFGFANSLAINAAGTVAYQTAILSHTTYPADWGKVWAWDLVGNTNLGVFASESLVGVTFPRSSYILDMLGLANGDLLIAWGPDANASGFIKHYDASGAVLHTYVIPGVNTRPICIADSHTPGKVWVNYYEGTVDTYSGAAVSELTLATGVWSTPLLLEAGEFDFDSPFTVLTSTEGPATVLTPGVAEPFVVWSLQNVRMGMQDGFDRTWGEPGSTDGTPDGGGAPNYLNSFHLGYACFDTEQVVFEGIPPPRPAEMVFDEAAIGLTWIEFTDASGGHHVWSNIALPDPPSYYGGYKAHRIIEFGPIRRGLSNIDGQYKGIVWFWKMNG